MRPGDMMTDPQLCLRSYLERTRDFAGKLPNEYCYRNVYDFVLREGRFFEPQPRPDLITLRHIGECFRNAFLTMIVGARWLRIFWDHLSALNCTACESFSSR